MRGRTPTLIPNGMVEHRDPFPFDVPVELRSSAEHVRAHLVFLRGGAPFLSPADALCLLGWLDGGVTVAAILAALDRCATSRRRNNARTPFSLRSARKHLGKPPLDRVDVPATRGEHPLHPLAEELADQPLTQQLLALPSGPDAIPEAVALCRSHVERRWADLAPTVRGERIERAIDGFGDVRNLVDEATLLALAEEVARERFRSEFPRIDTARIEGLLA